MDRVNERRTAKNANRNFERAKTATPTVTALDDGELNEWLMQAMEDGPGQFLPALAEAVVTACPEDYSLVRPVLLNLKRKYCSLSSREKETEQTIAGRRIGARKFRSPEGRI